MWLVVGVYEEGESYQLEESYGIFLYLLREREREIEIFESLFFLLLSLSNLL
jgi:hypothetical protein